MWLLDHSASRCCQDSYADAAMGVWSTLAATGIDLACFEFAYQASFAPVGSIWFVGSDQDHLRLNGVRTLVASKNVSV